MGLPGYHGKIRIQFLGTAASQPTKSRNVSGIMIHIGDEVILVDCGDGTQRQILRFNQTIFMDRIFLTHFHGDHYFGLFGLISTMDLNNRVKPLYIYAPPLFINFAIILEKYCKPSFKIIYKFMQPNQQVVFNKYAVIAHPGKHTTLNYLYAFKLHDYRRLDVEKLKLNGIALGAHCKDLKQGKNIVYKGKQIFAEEYLEPVRYGKKIIISGDTRPIFNDLMYKNCGLLIHECTYLDSNQLARAKKRMHTIYPEILSIKKNYKIPIVCTHFSARCVKMPGRVKDIVFAKDGLVIDYD